MALTDILEKISEELAENLKQLEKSFNEKEKKLEEEYEKKQKDLDKALHEKVQEKSAKILEKTENLATQEGKNELLKEKRKLMDTFIEKAIDEISKSDKYESIITKMLKQSDIKGEGAVVVPAKGKEEETKRAIKESGKDYFLSDKSENMKGGVIIKTDKIEIDNSFETIINSQLREDLEISLNKLLF